MAPKRSKSKRKAGKTVSNSTRAGTLFPVGRLNRYIKQGRYAPRHGASSGAFMAAVLEYLTAEVLDMAGTVCTDGKKKTIQPKHINLAFRSDAELG
jgi:histone H2A